MQQCADHVAFQLPNDLTRVNCLLDAIQCLDAALLASMALVRSDKGPGGKYTVLKTQHPSCHLQTQCPRRGMPQEVKEVWLTHLKSVLLMCLSQMQ